MSHQLTTWQPPRGMTAPPPHVVMLPPASRLNPAGDIDPAIVPFLMGKGMSVAEVDTLMNKKSGFLGLAGASSSSQVRHESYMCHGVTRNPDQCHPYRHGVTVHSPLSWQRRQAAPWSKVPAGLQYWKDACSDLPGSRGNAVQCR